MTSLTIIAGFLTVGEHLGLLEPVEYLLVHQAHVGVVLDGAELVIAVEILGRAEPAADQATRLTRDAGGFLESVVQGKLKRNCVVKIKVNIPDFISCSVINPPQPVMGMILTT